MLTDYKHFIEAADYKYKEYVMGGRKMKIDSVFTGSGIRAEEIKPIGNNKNSVDIKKDSRPKDEVSDYQTIAKSDQTVLNKAIEKANETLGNHHRIIKREIHDKTKAMIFKIEDTDTGEVINEFPSETIEDMIAKMWELAGLFVDKKA